ncbi:MAG: hypothetical protein V4713_07445 [Pseudomonadota bacterium]
MTLHRMFPAGFKALFGKRKYQSPEHQRAAELIAAIDAGGIPMNPARVNDIARKLGLDVSMTAPVEKTIQRIREVMAHMNP